MSEPVVLLPGMMCDARLFGPQADALRAGREVLIPEVGGASSVEDIAADILRDAPERFALGGLSLGGILAMQIMRAAPERVTRLALMDTSPFAEPVEFAARREPQIDKVGAGQLADVMRDEMKPNYLAEGPDRAAILDLVMQMALAQGEEVFIRQSRALQARPDQQDTLRGVTVPTLILCGAEDALCPVKRHVKMAELVPGARLVVVDNAGHLPTLEQPEAVTRALQDWLAA